MPGATSSHSGSDHCGAVADDGLSFVSAKNRAGRRVICSRSSPDVMENVDGQLIRSVPVGSDPHDQRECDGVGPLIQSAKRNLISRGDGMDEGNPFALGYPSLPAICVKQFTQGAARGVMLILADGCGAHDGRSCRRRRSLARAL